MKCKKCGNELHGLQRCPYCGTTMTAGGSYGRIRRSLYWAIMTPCIVLNTMSYNSILKSFNGGRYGHEWDGIMWGILGIACAAVMIRTTVGRLHDLDRSGWWWLLACIPYVCVVAVIVIGCLPGTPGPNRFGSDPTAQRGIPPAGHAPGPHARPAAGAGPTAARGAGKCQSCGGRLVPGEKFCPNCGRPVPEKKKCRHCGGVLDAGQKFCPHCGKAIADDAAPCRKCGEKLDASQKFCPKCGTAVAASGAGEAESATMEGETSGTDGVPGDAPRTEQGKERSKT